MLSNLTVRSNLLAFDTYQRDLRDCSALESQDAMRRCPNLSLSPTPRQREQILEMLSWCDEAVSSLSPTWVNSLSDQLGFGVRLKRPIGEEEAFEILAVVRQVYHGRTPGPLRDKAADTDRGARAQLARPEFRLPPAAIEARLTVILGVELPAPPELSPATEPPAPPPAPPVVAVQSAKAINPNWVPAAKRKLMTEPLATPGNKPVPPAMKPRAVKSPTLRGPGPRPAPERVVEAPPVPAGPAPIPDAAPPADSDFARVAERWPHLPAHVRQCVLMLIDAAAITAPGADPCRSTPPESPATSPPASAVT